MYDESNTGLCIFSPPDIMQLMKISKKLCFPLLIQFIKKKKKNINITLNQLNEVNYESFHIDQLNRLFEECHKFVPPEPYVSACNNDVCNMNNKTVGCATLQAYAKKCAMVGVCVDWRDATNGVCGQYIYYLNRTAAE